MSKTTKTTLKTLEERLQAPMEYKWRLQSAKFGKATMVAYIDSRQVQDRLDEVFGVLGWSDEYREIDGNLYCGITATGTEGQKITKWDVGTESNIEKEKGNSSDSFKRSAVKWGIGRFLYSLDVITLKTVTHTNNKEYPADSSGKILWDVETLNKYCSELVNKGITDDTKTKVVVGTSNSKSAPKEAVQPNTKPWLNKTDEKITSIIEGLKSGKFTVDAIKETRSISKSFETELRKYEKGV